MQNAPSHNRHATKMRYMLELLQCAAHPCEFVCNLMQKYLNDCQLNPDAMLPE